MEFLVISNLLLWLAVVVMAIVIFALVRQIGVLYERIAPAGALMVNRRLQVGGEAPRMSVTTLGGKVLTIGGASENGRSTLLFFLSPDCPICKTLLPALKSAVNSEAGWIDAILASDGKQQDHEAFVRKHGLQPLPYVVSEDLGMNYGIAKLPYGVVIDEEGKVASMGIVNSREHLESLFEAKERNVASVQEHIARQSALKEQTQQGALYTEVR